MTNNVESVFGGATYTREKNEHCLQVLENLLERAEAGEVIGVAIASLHYDACASYQIGGKIGGYSMIGALKMIEADLVDFNRD